MLNIQKENTILIEVRNEQDDEIDDYEQTMIENDDNDKPELIKEYIIDNSSFLRHNILLKSYYMTYNKKQHMVPLEEYELFSEFPPPNMYADMIEFQVTEYDSELNDMLQEERPGLLDIGWVSQVRTAHKASRSPMKVIPCK